MKLLRLFVTLCVSLLSTGCTGLDQVNSTRVLTTHIKNSAYIYDSTTLEGYYELGVNDNPFNQVFNVQNVSLSSLNDVPYDDFYVGFVTTFGEGVVSYFYTIAYSASNMEYCYQRCNDLIYQEWTGTDFFLIDIVRFNYTNSTYYFTNWYRYYLIGEQKLGSTCYFEDNILFNYDNGSYYSYCSFDIERTYSGNVYYYSVADNTDNRNTYFTRYYTEVRPCLLNSYFVGFTGGNHSSIDIECYLYSFHAFIIGNRQVVDYTPFTSSYKLKFGFSHVNAENSYQTGYNEGYSAGKDDGYDEGVADMQDDIDNAYDNGYTEGYNNGTADLDTQVTTAHTQGYNEGWSAATNNPYTFAALFGAIADTPIIILRNLLGFEIFGVDAIAILMTMITGCIAIFLIRKFF